MDILIYGTIGSGGWWDDDSIGCNKLTDLLADVPHGEHTVDVRINSLGGSCSDGMTMRNQLITFAKKRRMVTPDFKLRTIVDGFCYSAATLPLMAGDEIIMNTGTLFMIHNASTYYYGNAKDFRELGDYLEKLSQEIGRVYAKKTDKKETDIFDLMDAETYMTPAEALDLGFITTIGEDEAVPENKAKYGEDFSKPLLKGQYDRLMGKRYAAAMSKPKTESNSSQKNTTEPPDLNWLRAAELNALENGWIPQN